ncbi:MAG: LPS export ABC transporter permease LptG [Pseudomonadota bacterium]|nr:LPS export ABC transporter permease LptG [Pseudomonadota bacterium]
MGLLDRYIAWKLLKGWVLVWLVMTSIFTLLGFVDELERTTEHYQIADAVQFMLYTLPQRSMGLAPVTALLGALLALAGLNKSSELIAIRAAGVSVPRFLRSIALPTFILVAALYAVSEFLAAPLFQQAETEKTLTRTGMANLLKGKGIWSNSGYRFFNVRNLKHGQIPTGIYLYEFTPDGRLQHFVFARSAQLTDSRRWDLLGVEQKTLDGGLLKSRHLQNLEMGPFWSREELPVLPLSTAGMTPTGLYEYSDYLKSTDQLSERIEQVFWQKVALPLTTGAMVFLAVPIGAGVTTTRSSAFGKKLAIGAGVGILFYLLSQLIQTGASMAGIPPAPAAFLPVVLVLSVAGVLINRMR